MFDPQKMYSIDELLTFGVSDMSSTKPIAYSVNGVEKRADSWASLTENIIESLFVNRDFSKDDLPITVPGRSQKEYINASGEPAIGTDGKFNKVVDGVYVDIKYNAWSHIKNLKFILENLGVYGKYNLKISLHKI